jgi:cytidyltransferase-like protein
MQIIAIYPGRFHPFHKGHASSFQQLAQKFGLDNTYLAISAKQEQPKSPFSAQDRAKMAVSLGIPSKNIIAVRNPYAAQEYIDQLNLDPEKTAIVFGVSKKDMEGEPAMGIPPDPRFSFKAKKDGSPSYLQPFNKTKVDPMSQHGYVMSTDVAEFPIAGKSMRDASAIRSAYAGADEKTKMRILTDLYGDAAEKMKQVFDNNLQVTESIRRLITMIKPMLSEATFEQKAKFVKLLSEAKTQLNEYNIRKTKKFIQRAHDQEQGQMYGDMPYSSHPKQVANIGKKFFGTKFGPEAVKVALLHDVLEDTPYTPEQLAKKGFSEEVIQAVQLLTKNKELSYADNIRAIINSGNPLAMMVKYSDNYMNYTGDKSHWTADRAAASQKKYLASLNMLGDVLGIKKHVGDEEVVSEAAGRVYSNRQADIIEDLGNGYFLGDDSYDDDDGFVKAGYSVYKQVDNDSFRMVDSVSMSPYSNPPGHIENEIKKIIASDQNNLSESMDYLEEK